MLDLINQLDILKFISSHDPLKHTTRQSVSIPQGNHSSINGHTGVQGSGLMPALLGAYSPGSMEITLVYESAMGL